MLCHGEEVCKSLLLRMSHSGKVSYPFSHYPQYFSFIFFCLVFIDLLILNWSLAALQCVTLVSAVQLSYKSAICIHMLSLSLARTSPPRGRSPTPPAQGHHRAPN